MPIAQTDITQTFPNTSLTIDVLANDSGDNLAIIGLNNPAFGLVSLNPDQTLTYIPNTDFVGSDSFSYTIRDSLDETAQGLVSITVAEPNQSPDAVADSVPVISGQTASINVLANDSDLDLDPIMLVALSAAGHGTVTVNEDQTLRYEPEEGFVGEDSFTYTIGDSRGGFDTAIVLIDVKEPNTAPEAADDTVQTAKNIAKTFDVLANDSDLDGDDLLLTSISFPISGTLAVNGDFTFTYTPSADFVGQDSFTYQISDGRGGVSSALVLIEVTEANQPPLAANDNSIEVIANTSFTIDVLGNDTDPDGDILSIIGATMPSNGTVAINADKTLTYTPQIGYLGADSFTYTIGDSHGGEATASVSVNVVVDPNVTTFINGYNYRRQFIIGAGTVDLVNFPLLIEEQGDWLRSTANGGRIEDGTHLDIRFEDLDGSKLDHEIERYNATAGELVAWVRLPVLSAGQSTEIYIYYGKPDTPFDENNAQGVWRDYLAVYHLPDGIDRTGNDRNLTASNVQSGALIGEAGQFNGDLSIMSMADSSWLDGLSAFTAQMSIEAGQVSSDRGLIAVGPIDSRDVSLGLSLRYDTEGFFGGGSDLIMLEQEHSDGRMRIKSASGVQSLDRQMVAVTWQSGQLPVMYINGMASAPTYTSGFGRTDETNFSKGILQIGAGSKDTPSGGWLGLIDEVRFRAEGLSASWLAAEEANQNNPQTFYGMSGEHASSDGIEAPVALADRAETDQDTAVDIDVIVNDVDVGSTGSLTIASVDTPANGTANINGSVITYTPASGFFGKDQFTYVLANGNGRFSTGMVVVTVFEVSQQSSFDDAGFPSLSGGVQHLVPSQKPLAEAIQDAKAGDHIVLNGNVSGGTYDLPAEVVLRSDSNQARTISNATIRPRSRSVIWGLVLQNTTIDVGNGYTGADVRIHRVKMDGNWIRLRNAPRFSVRRCEWVNTPERGMTMEPRNGAIDGYVADCLFRDNDPVATRNKKAWETGQSLGDQGTEANGWVLDCGNVFERCVVTRWSTVNAGVGELISVKSNNTIFRDLHFKNNTTKGYFNQRQGRFNLYHRIICDDSMGFNLRGEGSVWLGCKCINGAHFRVMGGDSRSTGTKYTNPMGPHNPDGTANHAYAENIKIVSCEGPIIDYSWSGQTWPPVDSRIEDHTGSINFNFSGYQSPGHTWSQSGTASQSVGTYNTPTEAETGVNSGNPQA